MSSIKTIVTLALITALSLMTIGCSESDSIIAPAVVDTAPPAVPSNLAAEFDDGQISLSWDANTTDADLAGFIVSRSNYGEVTVLVASPSIITSFDDDPALGQNIYQVYSVDLTGNASAVATVEYHRSGNRRPGQDLQED
ncbi:MAG: hypothetical protein GY780_00755 [bacterium]|nr:hypothetical protein [bacterium]